MFNSLKTTLLEIYCSPIERAVGSFIRDFKHLAAADQQLVLKAFKVKSRTLIFNLLTSDARNGYINLLVVNIRRQQASTG